MDESFLLQLWEVLHSQEELAGNLATCMSMEKQHGRLQAILKTPGAC